VASLKLYFSPKAPDFPIRYAGQAHTTVQQQLLQRIDEVELSSTFTLLTRLEASFRVDFDSRCRKRLKDDLSRYFRDIEKRQGDKVRLDDDILEGWRLHSSIYPTPLIGQIRSAFKFRHWLAHGRYWAPKIGRTYDFSFVYTMVTAIVASFPFES
jgi:hypothetical protein